MGRKDSLVIYRGDKVISGVGSGIIFLCTVLAVLTGLKSVLWDC